MPEHFDLAVAGGGAAGFFAAIAAAEDNPALKIIILEQGIEVLGKVKISGGGRCNVTHTPLDVKDLVKFYPRGSRELLGPFHRFHCEHTIAWFENKGIRLKTEEDGRVFPITDDSQTIVDCLFQTAIQLGIKIIRRAKVLQLEFGKPFNIYYNDVNIGADHLLIATGSNPTIWKQLGTKHSVISPVPSLFTFTIKHPLIKGLEGISLQSCIIHINGSKTESSGPVLITHWGLSGPAILKLSAFAAIELASLQYKFILSVNWIGIKTEDVRQILNHAKLQHSKKNAGNFSPFDIAARFWKSILSIAVIDENKKYADLSKEEINRIALLLTDCKLEVTGKSTNKDEFVTAGGLALKEVDFKTMESKIIPHLYFAGEVLNIDAVTGGFNFQAAWTTGYIAGKSIAESCRTNV